MAPTYNTNKTVVNGWVICLNSEALLSDPSQTPDVLFFQHHVTPANQDKIHASSPWPSSVFTLCHQMQTWTILCSSSKQQPSKRFLPLFTVLYQHITNHTCKIIPLLNKTGPIYWKLMHYNYLPTPNCSGILHLNTRSKISTYGWYFTPQTHVTLIMAITYIIGTHPGKQRNGETACLRWHSVQLQGCKVIMC